MTATIQESAAKFERYLKAVSTIPPPWTYLFLQLGEVIAILDSVKHVALVNLNGMSLPVSYGAGIPTVGSYYPVYRTLENDRWLKTLGLAIYKRWTYSPAPILPYTAYPYAEDHAASSTLIAVGGMEYAETFLGETLDDGRDPEYAQYLLGAPVADLAPPSSLPRIAKLVIADPGGGAPTWVYGVEAAEPVAPETPAGSFELGRVYATPTTTQIRPENQAFAPTDGFIQIDTRRDELDETRLRAESWNEAGVTFSGVMRAPSVADQLELAPQNIFGDGRDGAGTALAGVHYNLATDSICGRATGDCAFVELGAWGDDGSGHFMASPGPAGIVAGDQAMVYIARAKEGGAESMVGYTFLGVVDEVSGGAVLFERNNQGRPLFNAGDYYAYTIRVPQYSSVEAQVNSRLWITAAGEGGPGALAIKTWSWEGSGRINMSGAGCLGGALGSADLTYDAGTHRRHEGQGLRDKPAAEIGDGIGMYGGGDGQYGDSDFAAGVATRGQGGAGGGWGWGGWGGSGTAIQADGYGEEGIDKPGVVTGDVGERGAVTPGGVSSAMLDVGARVQTGFLQLGCGGGVGHVAFSHIDTGSPGGNGGGVVALFAREGSPLIDADGAIPIRGNSGLGFGAGGGGGGSIFFCMDEAANPNGAAVGQTGGPLWDDAFHIDGRGGNGGAGAIVLVRNSLGSGSFSPAASELDLPDFPTTGTWLSEPVDFGRTCSLATLEARWALDGTDNIPPRFRVFGANDAQMTEDAISYPEDGDAWQAGDPDYPIASGVELGISVVALAARRYWQVWVEMDTGTDTPYDTPTVDEIILKAVA